MPRRLRVATGGILYHVLNRAAGRTTLFESETDYAMFVGVLEQAAERVPMRLLAWCAMPNHWHLLLWPQRDQDLSTYVRWLTVTHTQRWHAAHRTAGTGPLYQGRFKSFPVQSDEHYWQVCRYVERNPLRAKLVRRAENWEWSSLARRKSPSGPKLSAGPVDLPRNWLACVHQPQTPAELATLRRSVQRGSPYGSPRWQTQTAQRLQLTSTLRPRGRPKKVAKESTP